MSVATFIPSVWEARLLANYSKTSVANLIAASPTEIKGDTIIYNTASEIKVKDYEGTVEYDDLNLGEIKCVMDREKYWSFKLGDVDKVQANGDLVDVHTAAAATSLQESGDKYLLGLYTGAHQDNIIGSDVEKKNITRQNAYDYIVDLNTKLNKQKAPKRNRYMVINSEYLGLLSKDDRFTRNYTILENGVVEGGIVNGSQLVVSEELPADKFILVQKEAWVFGKQLNKTEALRLEKSFADGVRGLEVSGGKVIRPKGIAVLVGTIAATE